MSSYGWLTQSTIIPQKSKEIKVDDSGLIDLKTTILQYKNKGISNKKNDFKKMTNSINNINNKDKIILNEKNQINNNNNDNNYRNYYKIKRNQGVQQRIAKDQLIHNKNIGPNLGKDSYKCLLNKQKIYDSLHQKSTNHKSLLVDFQAKQLQKNQDQYKKIRQQFYNGQLNQIKRQRQQIYSKQMEINQSDIRQRLNWQKQILSEMKDGVKDQKLLVAQSFDKKLFKDEKDALAKVIIENQDQKLKIQQIKKKKEQLQGQRIRKLRKLNILKD